MSADRWVAFRNDPDPAVRAMIAEIDRLRIDRLAIIEECARVADEYCEALTSGKQVLPFGIAAAIRALKDKP